MKIENNYFAALRQVKSILNRLCNDNHLKELYAQTLESDLLICHVKRVEQQQPEQEKKELIIASSGF